MKKLVLLLFALLSLSAFGQVASLMPEPRMKFTDGSGLILSGGKVYTYLAGTSTPAATYTDSSATILNTNPVILGSDGGAAIWLGPFAYKIVVKDLNDVQQYSVDNVSDNVAAASVNSVQYLVSGHALTSTDLADSANLPHLSAANYFTGAVSAGQINNTLYVGEGITQWAGPDIGSWINAAYAALPTSGGRIVIAPKADNSCYTFATPIVFQTNAKYVLLEYQGAGGSVTRGAWIGCLNYTPVTAGAAITLDYSTTSTSNVTAAHGLKNILLVNNQCATNIGCSSLATGISAGTTNHGHQYAVLENVTVAGFGTGYLNTNFFSSNVQFVNPQFWFNTTAWSIGNVSGLHVMGGNFQGNGIVFSAFDANSQSETDWHGTDFVANPNGTFDYSNIVTCCAKLDLNSVHMENGSATNARTHYVQGKVNTFIFGGIAEDDSTVAGNNDWWFDLSGDVFFMDGTELQTASLNPTVGVIQSNTTTRVFARPFVKNSAVLTSLLGGSGTARVSLCPINSGSATVGTCQVEAPFKNLRTAPVAFSALATCAAGLEGTKVAITDSSTVTWGATITGGSTNHVEGYCDGTNWTVSSK